jgi:hypothetical protein
MVAPKHRATKPSTKLWVWPKPIRQRKGRGKGRRCYTGRSVVSGKRLECESTHSSHNRRPDTSACTHHLKYTFKHPHARCPGPRIQHISPQPSTRRLQYARTTWPSDITLHIASSSASSHLAIRTTRQRRERGFLHFDGIPDHDDGQRPISERLTSPTRTARTATSYVPDAPWSSTALVLDAAHDDLRIIRAATTTTFGFSASIEFIVPTT